MYESANLTNGEEIMYSSLEASFREIGFSQLTQIHLAKIASFLLGGLFKSLFLMTDRLNRNEQICQAYKFPRAQQINFLV